MRERGRRLEERAEQFAVDLDRVRYGGRVAGVQSVRLAAPAGNAVAIGRVCPRGCRLGTGTIGDGVARGLLVPRHYHDTIQGAEINDTTARITSVGVHEIGGVHAYANTGWRVVAVAVEWHGGANV